MGLIVSGLLGFGGDTPLLPNSTGLGASMLLRSLWLLSGGGCIAEDEVRQGRGGLIGFTGSKRGADRPGKGTVEAEDCDDCWIPSVGSCLCSGTPHWHREPQLQLKHAQCGLGHLLDASSTPSLVDIEVNGDEVV
jgi:hypothetical protein